MDDVLTKTAQHILRWVTAIYVVLLSYLVLAPHPLWLFGQWGAQTEEGVDATLPGFVQHLSAYGVLAFLLLVSLAGSGRVGMAVGLLLCAGHAVLLEALQYFVPFRYADWPDALGNVTGVASGAAVAIAALSLLRRAQRTDILGAWKAQGRR